MSSSPDRRVGEPDGTNDEVNIRLLCSDNKSEDAINFKAAIASGQPVMLALDGKICTSSPVELQKIVTAKKFTIADAARICPDLVPASGKWSSVEIIVAGKSVLAEKGLITLLYARNRDTEIAAEVGDELCDQRKSPLVIHIASDISRPSPIALSSPADGIFFDLLGVKNGHVPVRISWFTNHDYRLLTLPDESGRVLSINQLFGDNTLGPDGRFAEDGYSALAKFDGMSADGIFRLAQADNIISSDDPIFARLRLWLDENFDGVAQAHELTSLSSAGVVYIDLEYSTDFAETDRYGNQTKMKSIVGYDDGRFDLIFDLWFNVSEADKK